jgi:DNA-binding transcriptional ArsR family regulator
MIEGLFGNATAEKVLLFLEQYEETYAHELAATFEIALSMAQRQLQRFESAGLLVSVLVGQTRLYTWNPRYYFLPEVRALLRKALDALSPAERERYFTRRRRPRRAGKPA